MVMVNFLKYKKIYFIFSGILIVASLFSLIVFGLKPGIDFTGGSILEVEYKTERPANQKIREVLANFDLGEITIQPTGDRGIILRTKDISEETHQEVVKKLSENPNFTALLNTQITEIKGGNFVQAVVCENSQTKEKIEIPAEGIFAEIGSIPTTDFVKNLIQLNESGAIIVDAKTQQTSQAGIWAAGDCSDGLYHQNNIAVGDGIKALENIYHYLQTK